MTHSFKKAAVSAVLSVVLLSSAANAALNINAGNTPAAKPAYAGQQFAAKFKTDRDGVRGSREYEGKSHRGSDNDGNEGREGNEGNEGGHDGNDGGNDGDGEGGNDGGGEGGEGGHD